MSAVPDSYEEYLRRVTAQRDRDRDRFTGADQHLDEPIYDPETGKRLNRVKARLYVELDDEGLPVAWSLHTNDKANGRDKPELHALYNAARALTGMGWGGAFGQDPRESAISDRENARIFAEREAKERAEFERAHPFACDQCGAVKFYRRNMGRYKTARGLTAHMAMAHKAAR